MQAHHYLGSLPKVGHTLWHVAYPVGRMGRLADAAWECAVRDAWIGWDGRHQYDRLKWVVNNRRFLILPDWRRPHRGSRTLALCEK